MKSALRVGAIISVCMTLTACGYLIPRGGPTRGELLAGSISRRGDAYVIPLTSEIANFVNVRESFGFPSSFREAGTIRADRINSGDNVSITIWENVTPGLFGEASPAVLSDIQVDADGFIFVPYAGRIRAAGNSPESIRQLILNRLNPQTPDPQVEIRRAPGPDSTVTVAGDAGGQGVFPIAGSTSRLSGMIAAAGGIGVPPEIAQATVIRGSRRGTIWYEDIFLNPRNDIALRPGDRILLQADSRKYIALGATGAQAVVPFESQELSALEALAQVGGLNSNLADPTGVFVLRNEDERLLTSMLSGEPPLSDRTLYVLNLTEANGLFVARDFQIRDGDTVYVTEAPISSWNKAIGSLTGTITSTTALTTASQNISGN